MCLRVLAVLFLPSSRLRELFDSRAETLLGAAQRVFTMGARGVPPFPSPVPEGFHTPDQTVSIRGHEPTSTPQPLTCGPTTSLLALLDYQSVLSVSLSGLYLKILLAATIS